VAQETKKIKFAKRIKYENILVLIIAAGFNIYLGLTVPRIKT